MARVSTLHREQKYEEALGLGIAALELIRVAIEHEDTSVLIGFLRYLRNGVSWTIAVRESSNKLTEGPDGLWTVEDKGLDTEQIFDFATRLFHTAEQYQSNRVGAEDLASLITESLKSISGGDPQHLIDIDHRRIEGIQREACDADLERSLLQIARAAIHIVNDAMHRGGGATGRQPVN